MSFSRLLNHSFVFVVGLSCCLAVGVAAAADWNATKIPDSWKASPAAVVKEGQGYAWYRCWVKVPESWAGRESQLFLEAIDDAREAFINGQRVAGSGSFPPTYRSGLGSSELNTIKLGVLKAGSNNLITVRVYQTNENRSGFNVAAPVLFAGDEGMRLQGEWQFQAGDITTADQSQSAIEQFTFSKIESSEEIRRTLKQIPGEDGPLSPSDSLAKAQTAEDLVAEIVLADPHIGQPLFMSWDERGRLWLTEYLQYPNPAGLNMISRDKFLRTVYDKVPPPPPNHFRGEDRISIHEDTDGDGLYDKHKTFVDGLNMMTSFAVGRGGVWVLNPPYLLFYPDRNHDDVPDGDPEVHLEGFGLEDSHSLANSLRWGSDGWLYAAQGSTVSADIKRPGLDQQPVHSMGQLIWRYHPEARRYEVFAEGGGNAFGVEMDAKGRIFSGHNGGDTRGFHYVQGGYLQKGFGKHGPLSNPYAFGYFPQMAHHNVERFTHNFVIYEANALPELHRGHLFGVEPLQGRVVESEITTDRSSFKTRDIGHAFKTSDSWVRPVDIKEGPDGNLYVADMYEQRIDHASHYQGRIDKSSGRIYRLSGTTSKATPKFDYSRLDGPQLIELLKHPDKWHRQTAVRLLADRRDAALVPVLREQLTQSDGQLALETLWALHASGGLDADQAAKALQHADPYVRLWTVRLVCDQLQVSPNTALQLAQMAGTETAVEVRSQLASSARRLPAKEGLAIAKRLLIHSEDTSDIHLPLLLWWAIEANAQKDREAVVELFRDPAVWEQTIVRDHILSRILRRYAAAGTRKDLLICTELLNLAPSADDAKKLMSGFEEAFQGRSLSVLPTELITAIGKAGGLSLALRLRQGDTSAIDQALNLVGDSKTEEKQRLELIEILGQIAQSRVIPPLLQIATGDQSSKLRIAALTALQAYDDESIGRSIVAAIAKMPAEVRSVGLALLASRKTWTKTLLAAVSAGEVDKSLVPESAVRKFLLLIDDQIAASVKSNWGEIHGATSAQMRQLVEHYHDVISKGAGNPYAGRNLFRDSCGKCHQLFDEGGKIGPDLTSFQRDDLKRMLLSVVNPNAEIREGFETFLILTVDGRTLNGFIADQDAQIVALRTQDGQTLVVARDDIEVMKAVANSLMPEGLLKELSEQQVRDLFAYLRATQPLP